MDAGPITLGQFKLVAEGLACGHRRVLEMLALGESLPSVLKELIRVVEPQINKMICSILMLDDMGCHIKSSISPNLPEEYNRGLEGLKIGPEAGICGTAAYRREPVFVDDTFTSPLWKDYRGMAEKFGLRSCWSLPIISSQAEVLGTFAVYSDTVRKPTNSEFQLIHDSTHIAAVAIEHSRTREKLQKTVSLLNATIEATADGILVVDRSGKIVSYNRRFEEMWRLPKEVLSSGDDSHALTFVINQFERPEDFLSKVLELYSQPEVESFDVLEFKDGRIFERYSIPQKLGIEIVGRVWSFRDVTKQRREVKESESLGRAKTQFLADISHEIRTPVGAILGYTELMTEPHQTDADRQRWASKLNANGAYLLDVVNEILSLCRSDFEKIEVERTEINFHLLMCDIAEIMRPRAELKHIRLDFVHDGPIPEMVYMDATKLRQILTNIIGNAIKFTEQGGVTVTVRSEASQICFLVEDEGVGIKPELTGKLFKPFSQADDSIQKRFGGTGLGLALSQKLARALGGDINLLNSAPGLGSCFRVTVNIETPPVKKSNVSLQNESGELPSLDGMKILVVDDSADNQFLAAKFLSMAGAQVETASDGAEGVEKALHGQHDLIFMDLKMPDLDGFAATRELRLQGLATPIIALSAYAMQPECDRSLKAGFNEHITKPIRRRHLVEVASRNWKNRRDRSDATG